MTTTSPLQSEPARERDLIDAAIAVNEAPSIDQAFAVLAETGLSLLGATWLAVVVWDDSLQTGVVHAGSGSAEGFVGASIQGDEQTIQAILTGTPYSGPPDLTGLPEQTARALGDVETVVRVPLHTESCRATFHAAWQSVLGGAELEDAVARLRTLTRLTTLAERTLRERERARLETLFDAVADGVVLTTSDRVIVNPAARAILALPEDVEMRSALFKPRTLDGAPFDLDPNALPGATVTAGGAAGRFRIRVTAFDGRELVLDGSASPVAAGSVIVFRDVTEEHRRGYVNEQYGRVLFDAMPTAIVVVDPAAREVHAANRAFLDLVGLPLEDVAGSTPPHPWLPQDQDLTRSGAAGLVLERVYRKPDGRPFPVEIAWHAVPGDDGSPALLFGVVTDLSEKRRLERQLVQSGKLAAIGELAAGVAHEINNPLFAILGLTEFLLQDAEPGSKARERLELIQHTGLEIKEIVRALLDFARENSEERHVVALEDVVSSTIELVRRTNAHKSVELVTSYDGSGALVSGSPNQLKQLVLNLVANARQAMPHGGTIRVDVRRENGHVLAVVSDDGPGIDPDLIGRIFEPFFTTKRQLGSTGLGLPVSLGIAEAHGGSLTLTSEPGQGATFTLRLPVVEEEGR